MFQWVVSSLLGELLLCLKDSNKRTRESSSTLLILVSRDCIDVGLLIRAITGCLAAETSHMRSAAVAALSKIVHEHGKTDPKVQNLIPSLLQTILVLADDPSREVIKSVIVFIRVSVAASPPDMMKPLLPAIVDGLLKYHRGKDRFRGKIKIVMKKLVRVFGYDHIIPLVTTTESQILLYLKKLSKTDEKKKKVRRDTGKSKMKSVDEMMASDEEDTDDEGDDEDDGSQVRSKTLSGKRRSTGQDTPFRGAERKSSSEQQGQILIRNDASGSKFDVRDLADRVVRNDPSADDDDSDDGITFDERGRLVITQDEMETDKVSTEARNEGFGAKSTEGFPVKAPNRVNRENKGRKLGDAYKSKKAGGDVKKKGQKFEPYAYVPLDGRSYTKKNRRNAVEQLDSVVRGRKRQKK